MSKDLAEIVGHLYDLASENARTTAFEVIKYSKVENKDKNHYDFLKKLHKNNFRIKKLVKEVITYKFTDED